MNNGLYFYVQVNEDDMPLEIVVWYYDTFENTLGLC